MIRAAALLRCSRAAAAAEFALLAPVIFLFLIGSVEVGRLMWTKQTLDEVAFSTARCMAVSSACASSGEQKSFAVQRAAGYGISLSDTAVTPSSATNCRGFPNSSQITIVTPIETVLRGFVPAVPAAIHSQACFPQLS